MSLWVMVIGVTMVFRCIRDEYRRAGGVLGCFTGIGSCCCGCKCCQGKPKKDPLLTNAANPQDGSSKDLYKKFEEAKQEMEALTYRPSNEDLLTVYGLYKQITEGDVPSSSSRPGIW